MGLFAERVYESLKFLVHFARFQIPIYRGLREVVRGLEPDIVHLNNGPNSDTPGILAARAERVPAICHVRTFGKLTHPSVWAARSVSHFICISNAVHDCLVGFGVDADRCQVVPNAVDLERFGDAAGSGSSIRQEFGWNDTHHVIALVGRVVSWKGQDYFIDAIASAIRDHPSVRGLIVGDKGL